MVPPHPGGPGLRAWVRLRAGCRGLLRLGPDHRGGGPVAALPDARARPGWASAPAACRRCGDSRSGCCWPATAWSRPLVYGLLTNFWFWPFVGGDDDDLLVRTRGRDASPTCTASSSSTWPLPGLRLTRAVTCAVLVVVLGRPVLAALRRASRRAAFEARRVRRPSAHPTVRARSSPSADGRRVMMDHEDRVVAAVGNRDRVRPRPR